MDNIQEERFDEQFYRNPNWVAENGGYIHANNVLYYFATSPFFDPTSNNNSIVQQSVYNAIIAQEIYTRQGLEERLKSMSGLEYVVAHDPFESEARFEGPNGPELSNIWVINKQQRRKIGGQKDDVVVLAVYYVVGDSVYMAPSVHKAISNRTLSAATALNKMLSVASDLSRLPLPREHRDAVEDSENSVPRQVSQRSLQRTSHSIVPPHGGKLQNSRRSPLSQTRQNLQDSQALKEAFNLSMAYRNEYMDEQPLVGEPGNFMLAKMDATQNLTKAAENGPSTEDRAIPAPPPLQTDLLQYAASRPTKDGDGSPLSASSKDRAKRRKSKQAFSSVA